MEVLWPLPPPELSLFRVLSWSEVPFSTLCSQHSESAKAHLKTALAPIENLAVRVFRRKTGVIAPSRLHMNMKTSSKLCCSPEKAEPKARSTAVTSESFEQRNDEARALAGGHDWPSAK